jgi:hypothetical protein
VPFISLSEIYPIWVTFSSFLLTFLIFLLSSRKMRSLYLKFKGRALRAPIQIGQALSRVKAVVVHLPREPGRTIFALPVVQAFKAHFPGSRAWTIGRIEEKPLLDHIPDLAEHLFYVSYPRPFSKDYKELAQRLPSTDGVIFLDFNQPGSRELALLTRARVRWGFFAPKLFPFFNIMVKPEDEADYQGLVTPILGPLKVQPLRLKLSSRERREARDWLSARGYKPGPSQLVVVDQFKGWEDLVRQLKEQKKVWVEPAASAGGHLVGVLNESAVYIGGPGLGMELALGLGKPVILLGRARFPSWDGLFISSEGVTAELSKILDRILE